ncbi:MULTISPECIES: hypothetical protein [Proteus]|nr:MULTISPECIES: hypothetical protein [Proteus]
MTSIILKKALDSAFNNQLDGQCMNYSHMAIEKQSNTSRSI